jgi:hypothetical protein
MKRFEEYVDLGVVKKQTPNIYRADSLVFEAKLKKKFLEQVVSRTPWKEIYPNFIIDSCYDIILELIRAKLFVEGYKTDSHEAEVSFALNFLPVELVMFIDELRYFRNRIKYYGKIMDRDYSKKVLHFTRKIYPMLHKDF